MSETVTGLVMIGVPVLFNVGFAMLAQRFDYPDILRRPTHEVLGRFREGGSALVLVWWAFAMSAVLFAPLAVLLGGQMAGADGNLIALSVVLGVLASVVQFLGLIRWPFLVPYLAREAANADPTSARGEAIDVLFQSFNRYLGVAVGEHLGYALTGAWSVITGVALIQASSVPGWLGVIGVLIGPLFLISAAEFLGPFEPRGWKLAGQLTPIAYILWSLWLVAVGIALLTYCSGRDGSGGGAGYRAARVTVSQSLAIWSRWSARTVSSSAPQFAKSYCRSPPTFT